MKFFKMLSWSLEYKRKHPKAARKELQAALRVQQEKKK